MVAPGLRWVQTQERLHQKMGTRRSEIIQSIPQLSMIYIPSSSFLGSFAEARQSCSEHGLLHLDLAAQQRPPGPSGVAQRGCGAWDRHEEPKDLHRDDLGHIWSFCVARVLQ